MRTFGQLHSYLLSGIFPYIIAIPLLFLFSVFTPKHNTFECLSDQVAPHCILEAMSVTGNEILQGSIIYFDNPAVDDCTDHLDVKYFLVADGREITSPVILSCGKHWIQSVVSDDAGNVSTCEFRVIVKCPTPTWPMNDNPVLAFPESGKDLLEDTQEKEAQFLLGSLSMLWESGKQGPGTISTGRGDPGGQSYGLYQISSNKGYLLDFLNNEGRSYRATLGPHPPGSIAFNKAWKEIALSQPYEFRRAQHEYIRRSHYKRYANRVKSQLDLDVDEYSDVMKDVLWSTAVQHGPYNDVFYHALHESDIAKMSEEEMIKRVYAERSRLKNGQLVYFLRVGPRWKKNLIQRFRNEEQMALKRLQLQDSDYTDFMWFEDDMADMRLVNQESNTNQEIHERSGSENTASSGKNTKSSKTVRRQSRRKSGSGQVTNEDTHIVIEEQRKPLSRNLPTFTPIASQVNNQPAEGEQVPENKETSQYSYRILFVILKEKDASFPHLNGLGNIRQDQIREDQIRYLIGNSQTIEEARALLTEVQNRGYRAALITQFKGDKLVQFID